MGKCRNQTFGPLGTQEHICWTTHPYSVVQKQNPLHRSVGCCTCSYLPSSKAPNISSLLRLVVCSTSQARPSVFPLQRHH